MSSITTGKGLYGYPKTLAGQILLPGFALGAQLCSAMPSFQVLGVGSFFDCGTRVW
jgi:hypothetical protein